jgi:3-methyladenine DNA glycosylase/8-oxoguanine DNA glycosylase
MTTTKGRAGSSAARSIAAARRALMAADPVLGRHMERVGPFRLALDETSNLYEALAEAIVYQQLHGKAAATIFGRLAALGQRGFPEPAELLALEEERLRGAGLSGSKTKAVRDLAAKQRAGELPSIEEAHGMKDAELVERLTAVRGIGPWTVEMLLIFRLGRRDVLPATDYGIRQGFLKVFRARQLPSPKQVLARGERWRPHRTMASWYLWRALDS